MHRRFNLADGEPVRIFKVDSWLPGLRDVIIPEKYFLEEIKKQAV